MLRRRAVICGEYFRFDSKGNDLCNECFKEFFRWSQRHSVEYLLVGGYAVGYHRYPRTTMDIDRRFYRTTPPRPWHGKAVRTLRTCLH